ncbi:unnamed protein product [Amoebophrya sp. A120]|nr:unnamed protein product [Amoebophrya sp. A120]|eukprot:GSA120T00019699001.1
MNYLISIKMFFLSHNYSLGLVLLLLIGSVDFGTCSLLETRTTKSQKTTAPDEAEDIKRDSSSPQDEEPPLEERASFMGGEPQLLLPGMTSGDEVIEDLVGVQADFSPTSGILSQHEKPPPPPSRTTTTENKTMKTETIPLKLLITAKGSLTAPQDGLGVARPGPGGRSWCTASAASALEEDLLHDHLSRRTGSVLKSQSQQETTRPTFRYTTTSLLTEAMVPRDQQFTTTVSLPSTTQTRFRGEFVNNLKRRDDEENLCYCSSYEGQHVSKLVLPSCSHAPSGNLVLPDVFSTRTNRSFATTFASLSTSWADRLAAQNFSSTTGSSFLEQKRKKLAEDVAAKLSAGTAAILLSDSYLLDLPRRGTKVVPSNKYAENSDNTEGLADLFADQLSIQQHDHFQLHHATTQDQQQLNLWTLTDEELQVLSKKMLSEEHQFLQTKRIVRIGQTDLDSAEGAMAFFSASFLDGQGTNDAAGADTRSSLVLQQNRTEFYPPINREDDNSIPSGPPFRIVGKKECRGLTQRQLEEIAVHEHDLIFPAKLRCAPSSFRPRSKLSPVRHDLDRRGENNFFFHHERSAGRDRTRYLTTTPLLARVVVSTAQQCSTSTASYDPAEVESPEAGATRTDYIVRPAADHGSFGENADSSGEPNKETLQELAHDRQQQAAVFQQLYPTAAATPSPPSGLESSCTDHDQNKRKNKMSARRFMVQNAKLGAARTTISGTTREGSGSPAVSQDLAGNGEGEAHVPPSGKFAASELLHSRTAASSGSFATVEK